MAEYGLKTLIDPDGSILELPADIGLKIREKLDTNPHGRDWRALASAVNGKYFITPVQIEKWSPAIIGDRSSAQCLLTYLNSRDMTVGELTHYLNQIGMDPYKLGLIDYVSITIKEDIESKEVYEGDPLYLQVAATGHPYPQFQWFFCKDGENTFERLQGRSEALLKIDSVSSSNRGSYSCQIFNSDDPKETKLSNIALVTVVPNPNPIHQHSNLRPPDEKELQSMLSQLSPFPVQDSTYWQERSAVQNCNLISKQPESVTVAMNRSFVLMVETFAAPPVSFQWFRNKQLLRGQVGSRLHVKHAMPADFGEYYCEVRDGVMSQKSNAVTVTEQSLKFNADIVIVSHPKSVEVNYGGSVLFTCEARCHEPLKYQWFKDGQQLSGKCKAELKFTNIQDRRCEGTYQCEISLLNGGSTSKRCLTASANLHVKVPPGSPDNIKYNPSDKVALLIGNYDYRNEEPLNAPPNDVRVLATIFQSLQFKVVALLNLTQQEIENVVKYFCELIDKNVYVVFYFCGHGFEKLGNTFLVPTDARAGYSSDECVCTEDILESIQDKDPALIFMVLDLCRKANSVSGNPRNKQYEWRKGNIVYCYATSIGKNAFEDKKNGLLVRHMAPLLKKPMGLDDLVRDLKAEFSRFSHSERQIPHLSSNLLEVSRTLTDMISYNGQTEIFQRRDLVLRDSQCLPRRQNIQFRNSWVIVELDFQAPFANVLNIFCTVMQPGNAYNCMAYIARYPPTVSLMEDIKMFKTGNIVKSTNSLQDIQKLQDDLEVTVAIRYLAVVDKHYQQRQEFVNVNLGKPLMAALKLWKPSENVQGSGKQPTEYDITHD